ncbi:MAG: hypothetical protein GX791_02105 [Synergistaceae bacterium]|nr:hypothetical protein [Synergistaceae bacterium]
MLTPLSNFAIALVELVEAEVRSARKGVVKLGVAVMLVILAGILFLAALTLFLNVFYLWLLGTMTQISALFLCGVVTLALAGGLLWFVHRKIC